MKKIFILLTFCIAILNVTQAQVPPQAFNYSGVARDANGLPIASTTIGIQISILKTSTTGTTAYSENHFVNTDDFGLFNLIVGGGSVQSGSMSAINWSNDNYYLKVGMDANGGTSFLTMGITQLLSVPYALHAATADSVIGGNTSSLNETDPIFSNSIASGITQTDTANWNTNTEIDPIYSSSIAFGITSTDTANWNNHTVDTDTQLDSTSIASLGYEAGPHLDSTSISNLGFITNSDCGLSIGDSIAGGIIFYLDGTGCHGLVVKPTDEPGLYSWADTNCISANIPFTGNIIITHITYFDGVYTGKYSTRRIIAQTMNSGCSANAASVCDNLTFAGYSDWYLPSIFELELIYVDLILQGLIGNNSLSGEYWSSTLKDNINPNCLNFTSGDIWDKAPQNERKVRAIRAF